MSGEFEAAGALATAGLAAGALEGREAHQGQEGACLNCGATLAGAYCSRCGQAAHAHRTLSHMFEEVLHGLFHFDTKAWRTLPMLAFRPGTLTHNYIYGKRARYISPLALFLFTVFFMFFVFAFVSPNIANVNVGENVSTEQRADMRVELADARESLRDAEASLAEQRADRGNAAPTPAQEIAEAGAERAIALGRDAVERLETRLERIEQTGADGAPQQQSARAQAPTAGAEPNQTNTAVEATPPSAGEHQVASEERWQDVVSESAKNGDITVGTPFPTLNARILHSLENPDLALYKVQNAAYKFSFLLVPISLPFMWLLFLWRRGLTLYDHTVFTLYSLSFASVAFVVMAVVNGVPWLEWFGGLVVLALPVHMYFHLKGAYALSWWSALWRTFFLLVFAFISLTIFVVAIILLGLGG